jgi:hypothetical protein
MPSKPKFHHNGRFPVDAGNICFIDYALIKEYGGSITHSRKCVDPDCNELMELDGAGRYRVSYKILNTYNGDLSGSTTLNIMSGKLAVGDACYMFSGKDGNWDKFLDETGYLHDMDKEGHCADTGGDGEFEVEVTVSKIKSL